MTKEFNHFNVPALLPAAMQNGLESREQIRQMQETLGLHTSQVSIQQIPSKENEYVAVCNASVAGQGRTATSFGIANPQMLDGTTDVQTLVYAAGNAACANALSQMQTLAPGTATLPPENHTATNKSYLPTTGHGGSSGFNGKHSDRKPASEKQLGLISKLASARHMQAEDVAKQICNKPMDRLSSADANDVITTLKDEKYQEIFA
jgi:hypothetical protein